MGSDVRAKYIRNDGAAEGSPMVAGPNGRARFASPAAGGVAEPIGTRFTGETTDANFTTIAQIVMQESSVSLFEADVVGNRIDGPDWAGYKIMGLLSREGSAPAILLDESLLFLGESDGIYDTRWIANGNTAELQVKGKNGHTIQWTARVKASLES